MLDFMSAVPPAFFLSSAGPQLQDQDSVVPARPEQQAQDQSVPRRTSAASSQAA